MSIIACFDLWMSKGVDDIFALVINFFDENWQSKKVTIGRFEATETIGQTLARNLRNLLNSYGLNNKIIAFVKNEGENFNSMTTTLKIVVNCEGLGLKKSFNGTCFGHAISKTCQYVIIEKRVCKNLKYVSVKFA
jgi:hypothetical protein